MARTRRSQTPRLTAEVVADDEQLGLVIDEFISMLPEMQAHRRRLRQLQDKARRTLDDEHWLVGFALDDAHVDLVADVMLGLARWAFNEGQRGR